MPTVETAAIYPGLCLVEATELSEGRGTTRPFHTVGAPWVDSARVVAGLRRCQLPGVAFRETVFRPMFGKCVGEICKGVEIHVLDRQELRPLALGVSLLQVFRDSDPGSFRWRRDPYEFVSAVPAVDLLTGSDLVRRTVEAGGDLEPVLLQWEEEVLDFEASLAGVLLYHLV